MFISFIGLFSHWGGEGVVFADLFGFVVGFLVDRPDMTFAVDWVLKNNYLIYLVFWLVGLVGCGIFVFCLVLLWGFSGWLVFFIWCFLLLFCCSVFSGWLVCFVL